MKAELRITYCTILFIAAGIVRSSDDLSDKSNTNRPIVQVHDGQLKGIKEKNVNGESYFYAFRGIPYAKPPVDELRFKDPEQVEPWSDVRDAKEFGNACIQFNWPTKKILGEEDCLYLNVYTPEIESGELRAVIVWIPGGGFIFGSGNDDQYGPDYLVEKDVVLVTLNYRLGIFGFLNLDDEAAPGNQGLKDQVMALKWVQQNIDKFCGDPNSVTIAGESAGAASVHYLTLSPLSQGLFSKAILQSGVAIDPWATASGSMKEEAERVAEKLGNKSTDARELIEYFRSVDPQDILEAVQSLQSWKNFYLVTFIFVPSVDSKSTNPFMNIPIAQAAESGIRVPHIIGHNSHEGIFVLYDLDDDQYSEIDANQDTLLLNLNEQKFFNRRNLSVSDVKNFFMGNNSISRENAQQLVDLTTATHFVINIQGVLDIQSSIPDVQTYFYKFDYYSKDTAIVQQLYDTDLKGTCHVEDVFYLFSSKTLEAQNIDPPTSNSVGNVVKQRFVELWTNFAKTGNPNSGESELIPIEWKPNDSPTEYTCLEISEDLRLIKEPNILDKISKNIQKK
ncbi:esterase FE4-like [Microplitis mediator]|uniref:esterase FE4-like n=1 Tax=Microplitis mediator TaxID=375433 RepID=UPI002553EE9A|nr:esterase FE4-like [Microplitis mediator]